MYINEVVERIKKYGATRVFVDGAGYPPSIYKKRTNENVKFIRIFIRNDGWTLGVINEKDIKEVYNMWSDLWTHVYFPLCDKLIMIEQYKKKYKNEIR